MTENTSPQNLPEDPADFDLVDWLNTGTIARQHVTIYADQIAGKRLAEIQDRLEQIDAATAPTSDEDLADADRTLADDPAVLELEAERAELLAEAEDLLPRLEASRAVWEVRALSQDEIEDATKAVETPKPPIQPPATASERQQERFRDRVVAYAEASTRVTAERRLHMLATAVVSVTTPRGTVEGVTVDALRSLRARPYGQGWLDRLWAAVEAATEEEVEVPRPTSPGRSTSDLG